MNLMTTANIITIIFIIIVSVVVVVAVVIIISSSSSSSSSSAVGVVVIFIFVVIVDDNVFVFDIVIIVISIIVFIVIIVIIVELYFHDLKMNMGQSALTDRRSPFRIEEMSLVSVLLLLLSLDRGGIGSIFPNLGPYAPQGSTPLLSKLSVTSKVSAQTSHAWVESLVHFRSSEDVTLLEFTSAIDRE